MLRRRCGHERGSVAYELEPGRIVEGAREGEGSDLAEREARHGIGGKPVRLERPRAGEDARLRRRRLIELLLGAGEALRARAGADGVRRVEDGARRGLALGERGAHAGVLGTLAGEEEGYATHAAAPLRSASAPPTMSSTIARAL